MPLVDISFEDTKGTPVTNVQVSIIRPAGLVKLFDVNTLGVNKVTFRLEEGGYIVSGIVEREKDFYNPTGFIDVLESGDNSFIIRDAFVQARTWQSVLRFNDLRAALRAMSGDIYGPQVKIISPIETQDEALIRWATSPTLNILAGAVNPQIVNEGQQVTNIRVNLQANTMTFDILQSKASPIAPLVAALIIIGLVAIVAVSYFINQGIQAVSLGTQSLSGAVQNNAKTVNDILEFGKKQKEEVDNKVASRELTPKEGQEEKDKIDEQVNKALEVVKAGQEALEKAAGKTGAEPLTALAQAIPLIAFAGVAIAGIGLVREAVGSTRRS